MVKKNKASIKKRMWQSTKSNIFTSIALLSILANIFLLSAIFVLGGDNPISRSLITDITSRYCTKYEGHYTDGSSEAREYNMLCKTGDFAPFYDQALEDYKAFEKAK